MLWIWSCPLASPGNDTRFLSPKETREADGILTTICRSSLSNSKNIFLFRIYLSTFKFPAVVRDLNLSLSFHSSSPRTAGPVPRPPCFGCPFHRITMIRFLFRQKVLHLMGSQTKAWLKEIKCSINKWVIFRLTDCSEHLPASIYSLMKGQIVK